MFAYVDKCTSTPRYACVVGWILITLDVCLSIMSVPSEYEHSSSKVGAPLMGLEKALTILIKFQYLLRKSH